MRCVQVLIVGLVLTVGMCLGSCGTEDPALMLVGSWELVEVSITDVDEGDAFVPSTTGKTLLLDVAGVYTSNGNACSISEGTDIGTTGQWSATNNVLILSGCPETIAYTLEGTEMILEFACLENCKHKYALVQ